MAMPDMMTDPSMSAAPTAPMPDMGMGSGMDSSEVCIPLASLSMQGEDAKTVAPDVGDPVEFTATGTVSRVEGSNAYLTLETVNGEPVDTGAEEAPETDLGADDLRGMAEQNDQQTQQDQLY